MKFLDLEYAVVDIEDIKFIFEPNSIPVKTYINTIKKIDEDIQQKDPFNSTRKYLNLTFGSAVNTYIELKDGRILGTAFTLRTLSKRIREF